MAGGQRPDFSRFRSTERPVWCDVLRHLSAERARSERFQDLRGDTRGLRGRRPRKLEMRFSTESDEVREVERRPLIVFVMFGQYNVGLQDLETALYGNPLLTRSRSRGVGQRASAMRIWHKHGHFCVRRRRMCAISVTQRCGSAATGLDTLNRSARGPAVCIAVVYHHLAVLSSRSLQEQFGPFCDLWWQLDESGAAPSFPA